MYYQIVTSISVLGLTDLVRREIKDGWEPQGGLCVDSIPGTHEGHRATTVFYQAMTYDDRKVCL